MGDRGFGEGLKEEALGRHKLRCEDNIQINLQEVEVGGLSWFVKTQGKDRCRALLKVVLSLRFPQNAEKFHD
jgi:hypothetical protein